MAGTLTGATFVEVVSLTNPTKAPDGCSFYVEDVAFAYGSDCQTAPAPAP